MAKKKQKGFIDQLIDISRKESSGVLIPSTFLAIAVLDAIPTPTDIGYFYAERWLQDKQTDPNYWLYKTLNYYGWDVLWYTSLFGITYFTGRTVSDKVKVGVGVISLGAITYLLWKYTTNPV
jgi:hypothetical protein